MFDPTEAGFLADPYPEMGLTGYTCGDLFHLAPLQRAALAELNRLAGRAARVF